MERGVRPHADCALCGRRIELEAGARTVDSLHRCPLCVRSVCDQCWDPEASTCILCSGAIERQTSAVHPAVLKPSPWSAERYPPRWRRGRKGSRPAERAAEGEGASRPRRYLPPIAIAGLGLVAVVVVALGVVAGGGLPQPTGGVTGITGRPSAPEAEGGGQASGGPAASLGAASSVGSPALAVVRTAVRRWPERSGATGFHIVAAVENRSATTLRLVATDASYRLIVGSRETSGRFRYLVPNTVAPGERGYLIDTISSVAAAPRAEPTLEVTIGGGEPVEGSPERLLVSDITWFADPSGLRVRGAATNAIGRPVLQGVVGAIALDPSDAPIAGLVDLTDISPLEPGQTSRFDLTAPATGPLDPADIATVEVLAYDLEP